MDKVLTFPEIQSALRVSRPVAYKLLQNGSLPAVKCGRQWRACESAVFKFLHGQRAQKQRAENSQE